MVSSVLPLRNFSENQELKQLSYCFLSSLQFSPMLFIVMLIDNLVNFCGVYSSPDDEINRNFLLDMSQNTICFLCLKFCTFLL